MSLIKLLLLSTPLDIFELNPSGIGANLLTLTNLTVFFIVYLVILGYFFIRVFSAPLATSCKNLIVGKIIFYKLGFNRPLSDKIVIVTFGALVLLPSLWITDNNTNTINLVLLYTVVSLILIILLILSNTTLSPLFALEYLPIETDVVTSKETRNRSLYLQKISMPSVFLTRTTRAATAITEAAVEVLNQVGQEQVLAPVRHAARHFPAHVMMFNHHSDWARMSRVPSTVQNSEQIMSDNTIAPRTINPSNLMRGAPSETLSMIPSPNINSTAVSAAGDDVARQADSMLISNPATNAGFRALRNHLNLFDLHTNQLLNLTTSPGNTTPSAGPGDLTAGFRILHSSVPPLLTSYTRPGRVQGVVATAYQLDQMAVLFWLLSKSIIDTRLLCSDDRCDAFIYFLATNEVQKLLDVRVVFDGNKLVLLTDPMRASTFAGSIINSDRTFEAVLLEAKNNFYDHMRKKRGMSERVIQGVFNEYYNGSPVSSSSTNPISFLTPHQPPNTRRRGWGTDKKLSEMADNVDSKIP